MPLITTPQELQKYVKVAYTSQQTASMPNMQVADEFYLWPIVGEDLYNNILTPGSDVLLNRLAELCRRIVAPFAVADNMPRKMVVISDLGIHSKQTENDTPAAKWAYMALVDSLHADGCKAVEACYVFLFANATALSWKGKGDFSEAVFKSGSEFSDYYYLNQPYRLYSRLLPEIIGVQRYYIYTAIGEAFYLELIKKENLSVEEAHAVKLLKFSIANLSIYKACIKLAVKVSQNGFTIMEGDSGDSLYKGEVNAGAIEKASLQQKCEEDGLRFLRELVSFLNDNASSFPVFQNSALYKTAQEEPDYNKYRKGVCSL